MTIYRRSHKEKVEDSEINARTAGLLEQARQKNESLERKRTSINTRYENILIPILDLVVKKLVLTLNVDGNLILNRVEGALPSTRKDFNYRPAKAEVMNKQKISNGEKEDFILWSEFSEHITTEGVSINKITHIKHDMGAWSDACEHRLGGDTSNGTIFSYKIPKHFHGIFSINLLEFLAAKWTIYLAIKEFKTKYCHIAHVGDNTSAVSWLRKSNHNSKSHPEHNETPRNFVRIFKKK